MGQFSIGDPGQFCTGGYTLTPKEFAELQGNGPPEQAQGSAARPLAPPPHLGHNIMTQNPKIPSSPS